MKADIARILKEEGFIKSYQVVDGDKPGQPILRIRLKYVGERRERIPILTGIERVSRPGRRIYTGKRDIPWVLSGMGVAILSTPKGIMTGKQARKLGVGGEGGLGDVAGEGVHRARLGRSSGKIELIWVDHLKIIRPIFTASWIDPLGVDVLVPLVPILPHDDGVPAPIHRHRGIIRDRYTGICVHA